MQDHMTTEAQIRVRREEARAINARVAELVMGFEWRRSPLRDVALKALVRPDKCPSYGPLQGDEIQAYDYDQFCPRYLTDPAADYEVLRHVRETWDPARFRAFMAELRRIQAARLNAFMDSRRWGLYPDGARSEAMYEPGDYSRAALAVMEGE